jgi:anti-anti-sigma factor
MTEIAALEVEGGETTIAHVSGELDLSNTAGLGERILEAVSSEARALVLDLRETSYLDSSAIKLIFDLSDQLSSRRQRLHLLIEEDSFVGEVLKAVAVTNAAEVHTSLEDAMRAAGSPGRPAGER